MAAHDHVLAFEQTRPTLLGLAYRILGSHADAEDAVQDTWLKWQSTDRDAIENPAAWLTTLCTRRCLDLLRAAHKRRVDYVGAWLPEPIHTTTDDSAEQRALASSLTTAFLLLLERLTPKERAAYLLHEVFELPYPQIASTLEIQESTCRKLVSRARAHVDQTGVRHITPISRQQQLLAAFEEAIAKGSTEQFAAMLSDDIELCADGGGKVPAIREPLHGKTAVLDFIARTLGPGWRQYQWLAADINGSRGIILRNQGAAVAAVSFAYDAAGRATNIYIMRNPDKLARLDAVAVR